MIDENVRAEFSTRNRIVALRVSYIPVWFPYDLITDIIRDYGEIIHKAAEHEVIGGRQIETGSMIFKIRPRPGSPQIPSILTYQGPHGADEMVIQVRGKPPKCHVCWEEGHKAAQCRQGERELTTLRQEQQNRTRQKNSATQLRPPSPSTTDPDSISLRPQIRNPTPTHAPNIPMEELTEYQQRCLNEGMGESHRSRRKATRGCVLDSAASHSYSEAEKNIALQQEAEEEELARRLEVAEVIPETQTTIADSQLQEDDMENEEGEEEESEEDDASVIGPTQAEQQAEETAEEEAEGEERDDDGPREEEAQEEDEDDEAAATNITGTTAIHSAPTSTPSTPTPTSDTPTPTTSTLSRPSTPSSPRSSATFTSTTSITLSPTLTPLITADSPDSDSSLDLMIDLGIPSPTQDQDQNPSTSLTPLSQTFSSIGRDTQDAIISQPDLWDQSEGEWVCKKDETSQEVDTARKRQRSSPDSAEQTDKKPKN